MEFNIKDILQKKIIKKNENKEYNIILSILNKYSKGMNQRSFEFKKAILKLHNIPHLERVHVKRNKKAIIKKILEQGIYIRDII